MDDNLINLKKAEKERVLKVLKEKLEKFFPVAEYPDIASHTREEVLNNLVSLVLDEDNKEAKEFIVGISDRLSKVELAGFSIPVSARMGVFIVEQLQDLLDEYLTEKEEAEGSKRETDPRKNWKEEGSLVHFSIPKK